MESGLTDVILSVNNKKKNPFKNDTEFNSLTYYEIFKTIFMLITGIAIIRIILFLIILLLTITFLIIIMMGYNPRDKDGKLQDMSSFRRYLLFIPQGLARLGLFILGFYYIPEKYPENHRSCTYFPSYFERSDAPKIFIANHVCFIDAIYIFTKTVPSILAQANTVNIPLMGPALRALQPIWVPVTEEQRKTLPSAKELISERISSAKNFTRPIVIFPEGTTKKRDMLVKFQDGAFNNMSPVQPVVFKYGGKNCDLSWTVGLTYHYMIFRLSTQFYNSLEIEYLPVIDPNGKYNTVEDFKKATIDAFVSSGNFEVSTLTVQDNHFLKFFKYDEIDYVCDILYDNSKHNTSKIKQITGLNNKQLYDFIRQFMKYDTDKDGKLSRNQLVEMLSKYNIFIPLFCDYITFFEIIELFNSNAELKEKVK